MLKLTKSAPSLLPALTSSPTLSSHSLLDDNTDHDTEHSIGENGSDEGISHDSTFYPPAQVAFTSTLMPLKNKPFANRGISTSSANNP
jgi:hypothetical protein